MILSIELHPDAVNELQESYLWYEDRSAGLGQRFIAAINKRISEISQSPELYKRKKANFREALVDIFPYVIIYEVLPKRNIIFISYIFHTKRNPSLKYKR